MKSICRLFEEPQAVVVVRDGKRQTNKGEGQAKVKIVLGKHFFSSVPPFNSLVSVSEIFELTRRCLRDLNLDAYVAVLQRLINS